MVRHENYTGSQCNTHGWAFLGLLQFPGIAWAFILMRDLPYFVVIKQFPARSYNSSRGRSR